MNKFVQWLCCLLHWLALLTHVPAGAQQQGLRGGARLHSAAPGQPPPCVLLTCSPLSCRVHPAPPPPPPLPVSPSPPLLPLSLGTYMALHIPWVGLPNRAFLILTLGPLSLPHAISVCSHSDPEWVLPRMPAWPGAGEGEMAETGRSKQTRGEVLC